MTLFSAIAGVWLTGATTTYLPRSAFSCGGAGLQEPILIWSLQAARGRWGFELQAILTACRSGCGPSDDVVRSYGVLPLVFSSGAGFEIRQAMGIAVFAGISA